MRPRRRAYLHRRQQGGKTRPEANRALKRRHSDVLYRAILTEARVAAPDPVLA